jgi:Glycosyl hydrolases family 38 C-terminal domain/Glycosyl hydrolases family 38 C-terminal beta sandwich domain
VMQEARFRAAPWAHFAVRLWHNNSQGGGPGDHRHVEIDYTVGPLPQTANQSTSIALRLGSDIDSGAVWWTDAQGWTMQRRQRNARGTWLWNATEPVAGNFMPSLSLSTLTSTSGKKPSLGVLPDRAMGVASLADGELELMIHRRLFHDDGRGVAEPLNETLCGCSPHPCIGMVLRGTLRLVVAPPGDDFAAAVQPLRAANERPPAVIFWPDAGVVVPPGPVSFLATQLPHSVHLVTLAPMHEPDELLLRLAHVYEGVGDQYRSVSVDLDALFEKHEGGAVRVSRVRETLHNGVTPVAEQPDSVGTVVTLHPSQLRTFVVTI